MSEKITLKSPESLKAYAKFLGCTVANLGGKFVSPLIQQMVSNDVTTAYSADVSATDYVNGLTTALQGKRVGLFAYSGSREHKDVAELLNCIPTVLADEAVVLIDNADFTSVYDAMKERTLAMREFRFEEIVIDFGQGSRAGQGVALLTFDRRLSQVQSEADIPVSKNKQLADRFVPATPVLSGTTALQTVEKALARWVPSDQTRSKQVFDALQQEFPDGASPKTYWHEAYERGFTDFFAWGHDQDFGHGHFRQGTMSTRHVEIVSESIEYGYLPQDLSGLDVLDVGCWTGGDLIALAGMGANVTAIEEHPISAVAAQRMCELLAVPAIVHSQSLYADKPEWTGKFDVVYISGVIYHVTDPVLALRICFAYLKPGGRIVVETKASKLDGALCEYGGTHEKGWNWYSPTLETMGRWLADAGFPRQDIGVHMRPVGRLLAGAVKGGPAKLPERAGFARPSSWLETAV